MSGNYPKDRALASSEDRRSLSEIMERCRELHGPWLAERGEDVQMSLLTGKEITAMLPPIIDSDPGDENDRPPKGGK